MHTNILDLIDWNSLSDANMADILNTLDEFSAEQIAYAIDAKRADEYVRGLTLKAVKAYVKLVKSNRAKAKTRQAKGCKHERGYDCTRAALPIGAFGLLSECEECKQATA